jgi:tetratricopeptide (TPR) repeat protein
MANEKRLRMLEEMTRSATADSFAFYALALEYKSLGRVDEALGTFRALRERDAAYVPMYLMCGTMLSGAGRHAEAREWLESGIVQARDRGEEHAQRELEAALELLTPPPSLG